MNGQDKEEDDNEEVNCCNWITHCRGFIMGDRQASLTRVESGLLFEGNRAALTLLRNATL